MKRITMILALLVAGAWSASAIDRGLGDPNAVFIEKGQYSWSISGSYTGWAAKGDDGKGVSLAGLIKNANGEIGIFDIGADFSWFFKDNWSVGLGLGYANSVIDANTLSVLGLVDVNNTHVRKATWSATASARRYIPLFNTKVLALIGEAALGGSMGYNKTYEETARGKEGTFSSVYQLGLSLAGGACVFLTDKMSIELTIPVFSVGYEWNKMIEKQKYDSSLDGFYIRKSTDLLGIKLGIVYYF